MHRLTTLFHRKSSPDSTAGSTADSAAGRIALLKAELIDLQERAAAKERELSDMVSAMEIEREAGRSQPKEEALEKLIHKRIEGVSARKISALVYLDDTIITISTKHTATEKISDLFRPFFSDRHMLEIKRGKDLWGNQHINVKFPSAELDSVMKGLELSGEIDLSSDVSTVRARC